MGQVFVIRNQDGLFLTKQQEWLNGSEANLLFKSTHHDVALNTLIEVNSKDFTLRLEIIPVETNDKGLPQVEVTAPDPVSEPGAPDDVETKEAAATADDAAQPAEASCCEDNMQELSENGEDTPDSASSVIV